MTINLFELLFSLMFCMQNDSYYAYHLSLEIFKRFKDSYSFTIKFYVFAQVLREIEQ